jgi:ABC-type polysaccharide/polyol phosphate export permease
MTATSDAPSAFRSSAVRPGPLGLLREAATETLARRRLIRYLVQADLRKRGADTLLGNVWWVIDPLLQMAVYVVLVSVVFDRGLPDYALFVFAAILPWKWFQTSVTDAVTSVSGADRLIKQVQFPKLVLPISSVVAGVASFSFGMIPLAGLMLIMYPYRIEATLLLIPLIAVVQFVFSLAVTILVAGLNVFFRDIGNLARHLLRLWFYLSPGLYSIDMLRGAGGDRVPAWIVDVLLLNPFAILFTSYRNVIYEGIPPDWTALGALLAVSFLLVAGSTLIFKRLEPTFAKVL